MAAYQDLPQQERHKLTYHMIITKVAEWPALYGCDGIDLDLEEGAGAK